MSQSSLEKSHLVPVTGQQLTVRSSAVARRGLQLLQELPPPGQQGRSRLISPASARHLTQLACWGQGRVTDLAFCPGGDYLAIGTSIGVYFYRTAGLQILQFLETDTQVNGVAITSGGDLLAAACADGTIWLARLQRENGQLHLATLPGVINGHQRSANCIHFSQDGRLLITAAADSTVHFWSTQALMEGNLQTVEPLLMVHEPAGRLTSTALSSEDQLLAVGFRPPAGTGGSGVHVWLLPPDLLDHVSGQAEYLKDEPITLTGQAGQVVTAVFAPGQGLLATGSSDGTVYLWQEWDNSAGRVSFTLVDGLRGRRGGVLSLAFSPDGQVLASGTNQGYVQLWTVNDGALFSTFRAHAGPVKILAFSPGNQILFSSGEDETVRAWLVAEPNVAAEQSSRTQLDELEFTPPLGSLACSPDGRQAVAGAADGSLHLWYATDPLEDAYLEPGGVYTTNLPAHQDWVSTVAFAPDGRLLATGSTDGLAQLWQAAFQPQEDSWSLTPLYALSGHGAGVRSVTFAPDGDTLAVATQSGSVWLWPVDSATQSRRKDQPIEAGLLLAESKAWLDLAIAPGWQAMAAACYDNSVQLWSLLPDTDRRYASGEQPRTLAGHTAAVTSVAFAPDGRTLISGAYDATARLWRLPTHPAGEADDTAIDSSVLRGHSANVTAVAFSVDGRLAATGSSDASVRLWRVSNGALLRTLKGHTAAVTGLAFSPSGVLLLSVSADGTLRLWGVAPPEEDLQPEVLTQEDE